MPQSTRSSLVRHLYECTSANVELVVGKERFQRRMDGQSGMSNSNYPGAMAHGC